MGQIRVADSSQLDFETTPVFTLTVQASDGTNTDTADITVNLKNRLEVVGVRIDDGQNNVR